MSRFLLMACRCSSSQNETYQQLTTWKPGLRSFRGKYKMYCSIKLKTAPNLLFHSIQKMRVFLHYSKSFKWMRSNQNTGKMYTIKFLKRFCGWAELYSSKGRLFGVILIVRVRLWSYGVTGWLRIWIPVAVCLCRPK